MQASFVIFFKLICFLFNSQPFNHLQGSKTKQIIARFKGADDPDQGWQLLIEDIKAKYCIRRLGVLCCQKRHIISGKQKGYQSCNTKHLLIVSLQSKIYILT